MRETEESLSSEVMALILMDLPVEESSPMGGYDIDVDSQTSEPEVTGAGKPPLVTV